MPSGNSADSEGVFYFAGDGLFKSHKCMTRNYVLGLISFSLSYMQTFSDI